MEELAKSLQSPTESQNGSGKQNFKTFSLLRQQDDLISKFEDNIQKTLSLLSKHNVEKPTSIVVQDNSSSMHQESTQPCESIQKGHSISLSQGSMLLDKVKNETLQRDEEDIKCHSRISVATEQNRMSIIDAPLNFYKPQSRILDTQPNTEDLLNDSSDHIDIPASSIHEKEEDNLEDRYLRSNQNITEELNRKVEELQIENDDLRKETIKIKTDSFRKLENMQKKNDELLSSSEERFKLSMKNVTERYEDQISELQKDNKVLQADLHKLEERNKQTKDRLTETILHLEKEKKDLLSKINNPSSQVEDQITSTRPLTLDEDSSRVMLEQVLKDKAEVDKKYNDLFSAYSSILLHNKALCEKLEKSSSTSRTELPPAYKPSNSARTKPLPKDSPSRTRRSPSPFQNVMLKDKAKIVCESPAKSPTSNFENSISDVLQVSKNSSDNQTGKIRKNIDTKTTLLLDSPIEAKSRLNMSEYSTISPVSSILKPKNSNQMLLQSKNDISEFDVKNKEPAKRKSSRPSSAVVKCTNESSSATKNAMCDLITSPRTLPPRDSNISRQSPNYMKTNKAAENRKKPHTELSNENKRPALTKMRERSLSAKKAENKENLKSSNCEFPTSTHSTSKKEKNQVSPARSSLTKIPVYSKLKKI